jgi:hypothetical protein
MLFTFARVSNVMPNFSGGASLMLILMWMLTPTIIERDTESDNKRAWYEFRILCHTSSVMHPCSEFRSSYWRLELDAVAMAIDAQRACWGLKAYT